MLTGPMTFFAATKGPSSVQSGPVQFGLVVDLSSGCQSLASLVQIFMFWSFIFTFFPQHLMLTGLVFYGA